MQAYLDNSATTKPSPAAISAMEKAMREEYFNPSSPYGPALAAEKRLMACRELLAARVKADPEEVFFVAGGTEADNLAILGHLQTVKKTGKVLYTAVEHPAVKESCLAAERMGHKAVTIPVGTDGVVDLDKLAIMLDDTVLLLCIMQVNNETGAVQPLKEIAALRDRYCPRAAIHVDGVQGFLRLPLSIKELNIQSYALSGHKIHGPKGVGALVLQKGHRVTAREFGGGQEKGLRSGTENTPGIAGLYAAIENFQEDASVRMMALKRRLYEALADKLPKVRINGPALDSPSCSPHILNVSLTPVRSETMLYALAGDNIFVSMGSACSSRRQKVSETLRAMNVPQLDAESAIRFSLSPFTTEEEIDYVVERVCAHYEVLAKYVRR
jgi:cysteine desulfurase